MNSRDLKVYWSMFDPPQRHTGSKTDLNESYLNIQNAIVYIEWTMNARHPNHLWIDFLFHKEETKEAASEIRDINSHITTMYHAKIDVVLFVVNFSLKMNR